jgi:hypothetical protein
MNAVRYAGYSRPVLGQFRSLSYSAEKRTEGRVADLSSYVKRELAEVVLLPLQGQYFPTLAVLQAGGIEAFVEACANNQNLRAKILLMLQFSRLADDAIWEFKAERSAEGYRVRVVVGHASAMKMAAEHGYVTIP